MQKECRVGRIRVRAHRDARGDDCLAGMQVKGQMDVVQEIAERRVILEMDGFVGGMCHVRGLLLAMQTFIGGDVASQADQPAQQHAIVY